jgi:hypothetical protein
MYKRRKGHNLMKLTRRGKIVLGIALAVLIYLVSTRLWWVGDHWCLDNVNKCYGIEKEKGK